jgi:hypothetical protein
MVQRVQQSWSNLGLSCIRNKTACVVWPIGHPHLEVNPQTRVRSWPIEASLVDSPLSHSSAETYPSVGKSSESSIFNISRIIPDRSFLDRHTSSRGGEKKLLPKCESPPIYHLCRATATAPTPATIYNVGTNNDAATLEKITELGLVLTVDSFSGQPFPWPPPPCFPRAPTARWRAGAR